MVILCAQCALCLVVGIPLLVGAEPVVPVAVPAATLSTEQLLARIQELEHVVNEELRLRRTAPETLQAQPSTTHPPVFVDKVTEFFNAWKSLARKILKPILLSDSMFFFSLLMVLQWHIRFHLGELIYVKFYLSKGSKMQRRHIKPFALPRRLGINIMILCFYYDDDLPLGLDVVVRHRPFFCSIGLVFVDTVVFFYTFSLLWWLPGNQSKTEDKDKWQDPLDLFEDDGISPYKDAATNVYEDFTKRLRKITPVWFVQMMLVTFFVCELNGSRDTKREENVDYMYWVVAVIFQIFGGQDQVGEAFNFEYYRRFIFRAEKKEGLLQNSEKSDGEVIHEQLEVLGQAWHKVYYCLPVKFRGEWIIRAFMDFTINSVARSIILYTVPIMVCVEGPLDFVKDLTAVMFITMLDNSDGDPTAVPETLVKLKFSKHLNREFYSQSHVKNPLALTQAEKNYIKDNRDKFQACAKIEKEEWLKFCPEWDQQDP
mmetsp:Transcript_31684/g.73483  ORF Transcript_31684/g.73483 Transcript_31684/m.73483 type:complete len:485 (-) Transcript_31684:124-1578(-)|eukprot:CAMPEP_0171107952 /NCGR_PEP_ID=MMETSP0766_2-20121228/67859_1 /TAXON_ID=439317 /ORGANISM="Gambierdiscus australes, Strain CAWD 149" /LENGTH=484 /DNA_ID=CAMNT_0011569373 /DNA_START=80 /DNA_END=1534 /DNA_ORIENTATION=-